MKRIIMIAAVLCCALTHAQTRYAIDQTIDNQISEVVIAKGWNVYLVRDTQNVVSIITPCENFFVEGNEPQICNVSENGTLTLHANHIMPQGTEVEIRLREPICELELQPEAKAFSYEIQLYGEGNKRSNLTVGSRASFRGGIVSGGNRLNIKADSSAEIHIGVVTGREQMRLESLAGSILMIDSISCPDIVYLRNPKSIDNLSNSDTTRHLRVKTANRWMADGLHSVRLGFYGALNFTTQTNYRNHQYNWVGNQTSEEEIGIMLRTNSIPLASRTGLQIGLNFGSRIAWMQNNVALNGRTIELASTPSANNQHQILISDYISLPVSLGFTLSKTSLVVSKVHVGLEPMFIYRQKLNSYGVDANNQHHFESQRANFYRPFQLRFNVGLPLFGIGIKYYIDLLPTCLPGNDANKLHCMGIQIAL